MKLKTEERLYTVLAIVELLLIFVVAALLWGTFVTPA